MRWPGRIPAGRDCDEIASTIDLPPTLTKLVGGRMPELIDGKDIMPLMTGQPGAQSPHEAFFFYNGQGAARRALRAMESQGQLPLKHCTGKDFG